LIKPYIFSLLFIHAENISERPPVSAAL